MRGIHGIITGFMEAHGGSRRARGGFKRGEEVTGIQSYGDTTKMGALRRWLGRD